MRVLVVDPDPARAALVVEGLVGVEPLAVRPAAVFDQAEAAAFAPDVVVVATVSCIYGLGDPAAYLNMKIDLKVGAKLDQRALLKRLAELQYTRNDMDLRRTSYRVRGDVIDIFPAESDVNAIRIELFDDTARTLGA